MIVNNDHARQAELQTTKPRSHPWVTTRKKGSDRYIDFKENPKLIRTDLQDWIPYAKQKYTQEFYQLVEWINGPDSVLESSECSFTGPQKNTDTRFKFKRQSEGHLMIFLREEELNCNSDIVDWIHRVSTQELEAIDKGFRAGAIGVLTHKTSYSSLYHSAVLDEFGWQVEFVFFAYGASADALRKNMARVIKNLRCVLQSINTRIIDEEMSNEI